MSETKENDIVWVHCNKCLHKTRHEIIRIRKVVEEDELSSGFPFDWVTTYIMMECRGCGSVILQRRVYSQEVDFDETDYYPPPISRQIPRWHYELPLDLQELLKECYSALQAGSKRLAIMGARAIVDVFMNEILGDIGGFQKKLNELVRQGYLSEQNRTTLDTALEVGHAVTHRGHKLESDEISLVFDIVENMLQPLVLKEKSEKLKNRTPPRKKLIKKG